ncbi:2-methylisocitrate lyase-like PEP mutase family enzyme [Rhodobium orientis]|uniref:Carboxyvinyl-carboxyphosphonate phosphorylmutase n=1 Tax=Rhodobium orientis TaxID=34017 RepID=A0A327JFP6_9HYPH|nr:oxaloacetate decarboxylase [Rhodobium orientis]MBB4305676.1 2-methylisocitrate lyase-like PEP mutase family enzyme [Rhodobium orientis]MBK5948430.1 carboxyvinyl-carboxyphosphonate phosphorylmutase [Rhodobium orientis]RAI24596.1 carboxyvinyl-carboxyphosphonate phosphorylmutase [Rhodobium orientis]
MTEETATQSDREKRRRLRHRLGQDRLIPAPGIFEMISARIADRMDFDVLYMTGYGTVGSYLGLPDAGLATFTDMLDRASAMARGTKTALIADGDTGYGGLLNVAHTVRGYEAAGIAGIQLEDQEFPKKCGHTPNRPVIAGTEMVRKIRVAVDTRTDPDFLIVARTDALASQGIDEALRRAEAYAEAGADLIFVEAPESIEQMERIGKTIDKPLVANMVEGGKTPVLPRVELERIGYRLAIYPATGFLAMAKALETVYGAIREDGSSVAVQDRLADFKAFSALMGFEEVWNFEERYRDN